MFKHNQVEPPSVDHFTMSLLNIRSLKKHAVDLCQDNLLMDCDMLCLTETQISEDSDTVDVENNLKQKDFKILFNNKSADKFQNTAVCYKNVIEIFDFNSATGFTLLEMRKESFHCQQNC